MSINIKTKKEIEVIEEGGRILARLMKRLEEMAKPGIATKELDRVAENLILESGATPAFKGFKNYPATLCTSINKVIVHGLPSDHKLKEGDILSLDLGLKYKDYFTDMAITFPIREVSPEIQRLIRTAKKALKRGIKKVRPGNTFGDIGNTIQRYVEDQGFNVVRDLCGHGIGKNLHEEPQILNYGKRNSGPVLKEGMVFCIEPMITVGSWEIKRSIDGQGWETKDGSLSAHFEHTVAVANNECRILTRLD